MSDRDPLDLHRRVKTLEELAKQDEQRLGFALSPGEARVVLRALGELVASDVSFGDFDAAVALSDRLRRWHL